MRRQPDCSSPIGCTLDFPRQQPPLCLCGTFLEGYHSRKSQPRSMRLLGPHLRTRHLSEATATGRIRPDLKHFGLTVAPLGLRNILGREAYLIQRGCLGLSARGWDGDRRAPRNACESNVGVLLLATGTVPVITHSLASKDSSARAAFFPSVSQCYTRPSWTTGHTHSRIIPVL